MERVWQTLFAAALAIAVLAWLVPRIAERSGRPRFVVALVLAALVLAAFEASAAVLSPPQTYQRFCLGYRIDGAAARAIAAVNVAVSGIAAWGLWRMRPWARWLAMLYLGYLIGSFLIWGVRGSASDELTSVMLWQIFVLPFLTFGLMFLQRGAKYFRP